MLTKLKSINYGYSILRRLTHFLTLIPTRFFPSDELNLDLRVYIIKPQMPCEYWSLRRRKSFLYENLFNFRSLFCSLIALVFFRFAITTTTTTLLLLLLLLYYYYYYYFTTSTIRIFGINFCLSL